MKILFTGRVHPERAYLTLTFEGAPIPMVVKIPEIGVSFEAIVTIKVAQISAQMELKDGDCDLLTLKNYLESVIRGMVDAAGYLWGRGYDVEIISAILPNGEQVVFGVGIPVIESAQHERPLSLEELLQILFSETRQAFFLQRALGDLREAIRSPQDTAFFCYRALENIRESFRHTEEEEEKALWEQIGESLRIDRSYIQCIRKFRHLQAHCKPKHRSDEERTQIFRRTWEVVDRFCVFLKGGEKPLSQEKYSLLTAEEA